MRKSAKGEENRTSAAECGERDNFMHCLLTSLYEYTRYSVACGKDTSETALTQGLI